MGSKIVCELLLREGPKIGNLCHLGCSFTSCQGGDVLVDFGKELPFFVPAGQLRFTQNTGRDPSDVPINYILRDGNTLILNTRSAQALEAAAIPRSAWNAVNRTEQETFENMLTGQLQRNGLTSAGTATVRRSAM